MKQKIYFTEPYSWAKISYNKVWKKNEFRWKDKNFNLILSYDGPRDNFKEWEEEIYQDYLDMLELFVFYKLECNGGQ